MMVNATIITVYLTDQKISNNLIINGVLSKLILYYVFTVAIMERYRLNLNLKELFLDQLGTVDFLTIFRKRF
jgi:hypothetical protein